MNHGYLVGKPGRHLQLFTDVLQLSPAEELQNMSDEELDEPAISAFGRTAEAFARTRC
jgi:hypothetical protein